MATCIERIRPATPHQRLQVMIDRLAYRTLSKAEVIAKIGESAEPFVGAVQCRR